MRSLLPILALCSLAPALLAQSAPKSLTTKDTTVGRLALHIARESVRLSPDNTQLAFAAKWGDPTLEDKGVFLDKHPDDRPPPSPDKKAQVVMYLDDKRGPIFTAVTMPVFSPNSKRFAYAGEKADAWQILIDQKPVATVQGVPLVPITFSPDSNRFAITHSKDYKWFVRLDNNPPEQDLPAHDGVGEGTVSFSPNSQRIAYIALNKHPATKGWIPHLDGKPGDTYERFAEYAWLPDSSGIAFLAAQKSQRWQLFAPTLSPPFTSKEVDAVIKGPPRIAPNSKHIAFASLSKNITTVHTNTSDGPPLEQLRPESLTWLTQKDGSYALLYLGKQNNQFRIFINHEPLPLAFDAIFDNTFTLAPNNQSYAFAGKLKDKALIVRDGKILGTFDDVGSNTLTFSPDSTKLAAAVVIKDKHHAAIDGKPGKPTLGIAGVPIGWSPDSARIAFQALDETKKWRLYVDADLTHQSLPYVTFFKNAPVVWTSPTTLTTLGIQKKLALRVDVTLPN